MTASRPILLSGPMGAGKTTVGRALARETSRPFVDLDERIETLAGKDIATLFRDEGEPAFRALEERTALDCMQDTLGSVIAFGGGTVLSSVVRRAALERGFLVTLDAPAEIRARRIENAGARPLLPASGAAIEAGLERLSREREAAYAECHARISTNTRAVAEVVDDVLREAARELIVVPLGRRTYRVECVEASSGAQAVARAVATLSASSVIVVTDENLARKKRAYLDSIEHSLLVPVREVVLDPGEQHKNLGALARVWDHALDSELDRDALVVAVGGGVVSDIAGFAAATLLRGVRWVAVPSTLLAMVDASVGGKTGIDHATGKNRIGAFHQPSHVVIDTALLDTLEERDYRAGIGEVLKMALLSGQDRVDELSMLAPALLARDVGAVGRVVAASVADKARIVAKDEHDRGARAVLNLGHTVGHALEAAGEYTSLVHGEAVGLGLLLEHRFAAASGRCEGSVPTLLSRLLALFRLPQEAPPFLLEKALGSLRTDKKRKGSTISLPLARSPGNVVLHEVDVDELARGLLP